MEELVPHKCQTPGLSLQEHQCANLNLLSVGRRMFLNGTTTRLGAASVDGLMRVFGLG